MKKALKRGLYLVIDPGMDFYLMLDRLRQVVTKGIVAVQVWDNFRSEGDVEKVSAAILDICRQQGVPVLLNNRWEEAVRLGADGVHFDHMPEDWAVFKEHSPQDMLVGLTVNNDLEVAKQAVGEGIDYVSFCSMFPSETANSCDLVALESVRQLTEAYDIPVFLAGGIRPNNLAELHELNYHGIAVVSGVMGAEDAGEAVDMYHKNIKQ